MIALVMGGPAALLSRRPMAHLLRGFLWVGATFLFFTSLKHLGLAEATAAGTGVNQVLGPEAIVNGRVIDRGASEKLVQQAGQHGLV